VAAGRGSGSPLKMDLIELTTAVQPDEPVVTSGLQGSLFPPGLPIGKVKSARVEPGALQQEVELDPAVDVKRLELVKVLLWSPQP
jgi:rod shape-determining protein MreC